jgi:xanthine dehydrogenase accessory factor
MGTLEPFQAAAELSGRGEPFVLATVVDSGGSSPQKPGARLLMRSDGSIVGTVGGGAIEKRVLEEASRLLPSPDGTTFLLQVHLTFELGMCCGGRMSVFVEKHGD